jgi:hypothetical protein
MTQVPIKLLKDKTQRPFIPYVPAEAITVDGTNYMLGDPEGLLELLKVVPSYNASREQLFEQNSGALRWIDKPVIPTKTSQLTNDSNFAVDANYVHTDNNYTTTEKNKLSGIASGAEVNVQADWNETNTSSDAYIKNKPVIPVFTQTQSDWDEADPSDPAYIKNKPSIPTNISDLNNDSTFEDTTNKVTSISNVSTDTEYPSAKSVYDYIYNYAPPAYLGSITDYNTQAKALDITDLKPGLYLLYGDYYNAGESLYVKFKYNGNYIVGHKTFTQNYFLNHQLCLKINDNSSSAIDDVLGTISYSEVTDGGSSNATTIPLTLKATTISFSGATEQGFNAVKLDDTQTITGLKMFSALPRSVAVPTVGEELTNKTYVDSVAGGIGLEDVYDVSELEEYDSGATYQAGDYVYDNDKIFKYTSAAITIDHDCGIFELYRNYPNATCGLYDNYLQRFGIGWNSTTGAGTYIYKIYSQQFSFSDVQINDRLTIAVSENDYSNYLDQEQIIYINSSLCSALTQVTSQASVQSRYTYTNPVYPNPCYLYIGYNSERGLTPSGSMSWGTPSGVVDLNGGMDPTRWSEKTYLEYLDESINTGTAPVILTYNGVDNATNRATIQTYYDNNRAGIPTVLLLVTDENTPMPTGANRYNSIIVPMSLDDSSATFPENSRACMIGMASTLDWGRPLYAKQILNMSGGHVNSLYNIQWPTPTYMEFELWYQKSGLSAYDDTATYAVGDYVYSSGMFGLTIYKCNTAINTPEAWNVNHWTEKTYLEYLQDEIVNNALGGSY